MSSNEHDRFGPWAVKIGEQDPLPPLFVSYMTPAQEPLLAVKIPRNIERRNATPQMHLYDYVVALYSDDLLILQRVGDEVRAHSFPYNEIQYLTFAEELLRGSLRLGMRDTAFVLPFSTVSSDLMQELVDQVRGRYGGTAETAVLPPPAAAGDDLSYYFHNMLQAGARQKSPFQLLAAQGNRAIGAQAAGFVQRIFYGVTGKTLLESLHLSDGRELQIITRGREFKYKWQTVYGKTTTYLPLANISGARWERDAQNTAVVRLYIDTAAAEPLVCPFSAGSPTTEVYDRFLSAVCARSST